MKTTRRTRARGGVAALGAAALLTAAVLSPSTASASDGNEPHPGLVAFDGPLPAGVSLPEYKPVPGEIPLETSQGLWDLAVSGEGSSANTFEWVSETETLRIYTAESESHWQDLVATYLPAQQTEIVRAVNSRAAIDEVLETIVRTGGQLSDGSRIVTAVPKYDGSGITVGVDNAGMSARSSAPLDIEGELGTSVPLVVEEAAEVVPAKRNHAPSDPYWFAGATMSTKHTVNDAGKEVWGECTTAFRVGQLNGGTSVGMLSAEHCGRGKPTTQWHYSTTNNGANQNSATWLGDFQGPMSAVGYQSDTALWTAGNLAKLYPLVLTGNHNDVNSLAAIQGGVYPAVGTDVCYSGSPSGRVCGNEVTTQAAVVCYSVSQCYYGVTYTSQNTGTPAAGNGDSGGPVYQSVGGKIMAAGVISGIVNGTTTCTGEPAVNGRLCSSVAIYAPIAAALGNGSGWGLSYYP